MYRTLFEVKILHHYYLANKDGQSVLDTTIIETGQAQRMSALTEKFGAGIPSINNVLLFSFPEFYKTVYAKYDIRLLSTYSGFRVLIPVKEQLQSDLSRWYKPAKPIPSDLPVVVKVSRNGEFIDAISNGRISTNFPARYYFTNADPNGVKRLPVLSEPVAARNNRRVYEQGELLSSGNSLFAIYFDKNGAEQLLPVPSNGFANESDRLAVSPRFIYSFQGNDINEYTFVLKNQAGQILKTISAKTDRPVRGVSLDFNNVLSSDVGDSLKPHLLEVTGSGNYREQHTINFIDDEGKEKSIWGWVSIYTQSGTDAFQLFDRDGFLQFKTNSGGQPINNAPLFEIWLKSRFSFWRYRNNRGRKIKQRSDLDTFLEFNDGLYVSKSLRNASYAPTEFQEGSATRFLANPASFELFAREQNRVFTDVLVPDSAPFETE